MVVVSHSAQLYFVLIFVLYFFVITYVYRLITFLSEQMRVAVMIAGSNPGEETFSSPH
jgi:hypothetical protein